MLKLGWHKINSMTLVIDRYRLYVNEIHDKIRAPH